MYESLARNLLSIDFRGEKFRVIHRFETFHRGIIPFSQYHHLCTYDYTFSGHKMDFSVSEKRLIIVIIVETLIDEYSR